MVPYDELEVENSTAYELDFGLFETNDELSTYGLPVAGLTNFSLIHNSTVRLDNKVYPAMQILITPIIESGNNCTDMLDFEWQVMDYMEDSMQV